MFARRGTVIVRALVVVRLVRRRRPTCARRLPGATIVVVDRSRSMPGDADAVATGPELAEDARREGVASASSPSARTRPSNAPERDARFSGFTLPLDRDGSDLGGALDTALALIPEDRPGSLLVVSDGENNGREPLPVARRAFARGVRIDVRPMARASGDDVAVERLDLPDEVAAGEPFQFSVWVKSEARTEREFALERDGRVLSSGKRTLEPGLNRLVFRDVLARAGVGEYQVRLAGAGDRTPENDTARGAVRVAGARSVLVVNHDGADDTLARALREAGIPVEVAQPESARLDRIALTGHRAVVLENVAADRIAGGLRCCATSSPSAAADCSSPAARRASASAATTARWSTRCCPCRWRCAKSTASSASRWPSRSIARVRCRSRSRPARRWTSPTSAPARRSSCLADRSVGVIAVDSAHHIVRARAGRGRRR